MSRCPVCNAEVAEDARYCPICGATLHPPAPDAVTETPLPVLSLQPAGDGVLAAQPALDRALTPRQVGIAVGAILLFILGLVWLYRPWSRGGSSDNASLPVLGIVGEPVIIGNTVLGVAFTGTPRSFRGQTARQDRLFAVGVIIGNNGRASFALSQESLALINAGNTAHFRPAQAVWGTPDELNAGHYRTGYRLLPRQAIAGLLIFDLPRSARQPLLLVRDFTTNRTDYTGAIDLTREARGRRE